MKKKQPSIGIQGLNVSNFKGIKKLEVSGLPRSSWFFLTGENGYGKTSILQALALGVYGFEGHTYGFEGKEDLNIECTINGKDNGRFSIQNGEEIWDEVPKSEREKNLVNELCCYGSSRLNMASEDSIKEKSPTKSLFETTTLLNNIENQLSRWYFKEHSKEYKAKFKYVTNVFKELLNVSEITVDEKTDTIYYTEKDRLGENYKPLPSKQLAAGYRNIISLVGDMILRLFQSQPTINDPKKLCGIVIIDELDIHFHPKLQKQLPTLLSKIFPKVQFIVSTHSPIPLLGAPLGSVFLRVNRTVEEGVTLERLEQLEKELPDLLPNSILSSPLFGMHEIFPITHDARKRIRTEETYEEIKLNDRVEKRLEGFLSPEQEKALLEQFKPKTSGKDDF